MCFPNSFDSWYKIMLPDVVISSLGETGYIGMLKWMVNVRLKLQPLINMVDDRIKFQVDIYPE